MSCFLFPKKICNKLDALVRNFWWGEKDSKKKIHWRKWSVTAAPRFSGGIGFKDFEGFNKALLAKQCWRLISYPESCGKGS